MCDLVAFRETRHGQVNPDAHLLRIASARSARSISALEERAMRLATLWLLCALVLVGCATRRETVYTWVATESAQRQYFERDKYECARDATYSATQGGTWPGVGFVMGTRRGFDAGMMEMCMRAHGYYLRLD